MIKVNKKRGEYTTNSRGEQNKRIYFCSSDTKGILLEEKNKMSVAKKRVHNPQKLRQSCKTRNSFFATLKTQRSKVYIELLAYYFNQYKIQADSKSYNTIL